MVGATYGATYGATHLLLKSMLKVVVATLLVLLAVGASSGEFSIQCFPSSLLKDVEVEVVGGKYQTRPSEGLIVIQSESSGEESNIDLIIKRSNNILVSAMFSVKFSEKETLV